MRQAQFYGKKIRLQQLQAGFFWCLKGTFYVAAAPLGTLDRRFLCLKGTFYVAAASLGSLDRRFFGKSLAKIAERFLRLFRFYDGTRTYRAALHGKNCRTNQTHADILSVPTPQRQSICSVHIRTCPYCPHSPLMHHKKHGKTSPN